MAGKTATLAIKIVGDASSARRAFDDTATASDKFQRGLDRASVAAAGALAGIGALAKSAFDQASALQQSSGAIEAVFGAQAKAIEGTARTAADSVGLSTSAYENLAAVIGSQLKNAGIPIDQVTAKTQDLIKTGADLSAIYGGTAAEAVEALSSALKGEFDPMERYGTTLSQTAVKAQMVADGTDRLTGAQATAAQKMAVLELVAKQTADAHGAYAAQMGTAAEQQQRLSAKWDDAKASLGEALLPVLTAAASALADLAGWASQNVGTVQALVIAFAGIAGTILAVNGAIKAYKAITTIATAAQWLWNAAMSANPLGLIVLAIAAVVAAVVFMYSKFEWFRDLVQAIGQFFVNAFQTYLLPALQWVWDKVQLVGSAFSWLWDSVLAPALSWVAGAFQSFVIAPLQWVWDKVQAVGSVFSTVFNAIGAAARWVGDMFNTYVVGPLKWIWDKIQAVGSFVGNLFGAPADPTAGLAAAAARGTVAAAPDGLRAAAAFGLSASSGGGGIGPTAAAGPTQLAPTVNITIQGALDPVAVGRQITGLLRDYGVVTGRTRTLAVGR